MSHFFFKICSVSVIITNNMDEKRSDGQQILWMTSASSSTSALEYINMEGEDDFEVEFSTEELVQLVH